MRPIQQSAVSLLFVLVFGVIATTLLHISHAATPTASFQAEGGTISAAASSIIDTTASGNGAVKFGAGGGTTPTSWPNSSNTGYKKAPDYPGSLHTCATPIQSNTTYNFCDFSGGVSVGTTSVPVTNVTFHGCWFHGTNSGDALVGLWGDNITFEYASFTPNIAAPPVSYSQGYQYGIEANGGYNTSVQKFTITNSDFWGFGNAIDIGGSTQAKPQVFRDNYVHDARADGGVDHTDGIGQLNTGSMSYVVIDHNTIMGNGNTNALAFQYGPYDHFTITNNYFSGYGYMLNIGGPNGPKNTIFTDNTWGTDFQQAYGPWYSWSGTGNTWRRNKIHYVNPIRLQGDNVNSYVFKASDDGKFWTPTGVSSTDYTGN